MKCPKCGSENVGTAPKSGMNQSANGIFQSMDDWDGAVMIEAFCRNCGYRWNADMVKPSKKMLIVIVVACIWAAIVTVIFMYRAFH